MFPESQINLQFFSEFESERGSKEIFFASKNLIFMLIFKCFIQITRTAIITIEFVSVSCLFLTYFLNSTEKRAITANSAIFLIKLQVGDSANLIEKQRDFSSLSLRKMKESIVLSYCKHKAIDI